MSSSKRTQKGFTIIELMIAVTVFSTVLLILSYGIINIGRMYYKNITSARTQEAARRVVEDISSSVQFSGSDVVTVSGNPTVFCAGTDRYIVFLNSQVSSQDNRHALWREPTVQGVCDPFTGFGSNGQELLGESMQLLGFEVSEESGGIVNIQLSAAHTPQNGNDVLEDTDGDGQLDTCKAGAGSQFCAVSTLDTTVKRRIN